MADGSRFRRRIAGALDFRRIAEFLVDASPAKRLLAARAIVLCETLDRAMAVPLMPNGEPRMYSASLDFLAKESFAGRGAVESWLRDQRSAGFGVAELLRAKFFLELVVVCRCMARLENADAYGEEHDLAILGSLVSYSEDELIAEALEFEGDLRLDPSGDYLRLAGRTRNDYRLAVERIALAAGCSCQTVAIRAIQLALQANEASHVRRHVGYYLVDEGEAELRREVGARASWWHGARNWLPATAACFVWILLMIPFLWMGKEGPPTISDLLIFVALSVLVIDLVSCAFWAAVAERLPFRSVPQVEMGRVLAEGVAMAAIPTMLTSLDSFDHFLSSMSSTLTSLVSVGCPCVILADWPDADEPSISAPERILIAQITERVANFNERVLGKGGGLWLTLRDRVWSPTQRRWMGWERKRGKVLELLARLDGRPNGIMVVAGPSTRLPPAKFLAVIDDDNSMTGRDVLVLVGCALHPLVQPELSAAEDRVIRGHAVIAPSLALKKANENPTRSHPRNTQFDWFGECAYSGKGLFHVSVARKLLKRHVPEDAILSHDTFESFWLRPGYCAHAVVREGYPGSYDAVMLRQHRWIRGDWQNFFALLPRMQGVSICGIATVLGQIRRSLVAPISVLLFVLGLVSGSWRLSLAALAIPMAFRTFTIFRSVVIVLRTNGVLARQSIAGRQWRGWAMEIPLELWTIAHRAFISTDAILRTFVRILTRRNLLEWTSSFSTDQLIRKWNLSRLLSLTTAVTCFGLVLVVPAILGKIALLPWVASPLLLTKLRRREAT